MQATEGIDERTSLRYVVRRRDWDRTKLDERTHNVNGRLLLYGQHALNWQKSSGLNIGRQFDAGLQSFEAT